MAEEKKVILLVEDDKFLAELYSTKLNLEGYETDLATEGKKGLRMAKEKQYDLILLDVILPGMDGFEILKNLKSDKKTRGIPVILLTNLSQKDEIMKGLELGADDYLIKAHFMPSEVVKKIKQTINRDM